MNRFHVPPLPDSPRASPEPDPLLEKFRDNTIKGKKITGKPRKPTGSGADFSSIDASMPDLDPAGDSANWGVDDTDSW